MLVYFILGAVLGIALPLAGGKSSRSRECDGDCYTCEWYENGCKDNEDDYEFYEELYEDEDLW